MNDQHRSAKDGKFVTGQFAKENPDTTVTETTVRGHLAKSVTIHSIGDKIVSVAYLQPEGTTLTICMISLQNGTIVTGESACVSPEIFNEEIGKKIAYDDAYQKIWALEGYLLKEQHYHAKHK